MPTTARSLLSTMVSHPAARMRSPPTPKNSRVGVGTGVPTCPSGRKRSASAELALGWAGETPAPSRARSASMSCAPYISPEASPADIRIRTGYCKGQNRGLGARATHSRRKFGAFGEEVVAALLGGGEELFELGRAPQRSQHGIFLQGGVGAIGAF